VEELLDRLRSRPYYEGQIAATRTEPGRKPEYADLDLESRLASALSDRGIGRLYRHQASAVEAVRDGENVVLATRTASGKSLAYTVPAFERAMDHGGRTLYLGPTNALVNDQAETLDDLARGLGFGSRVSVERYTGQLDDGERREVRDRRPTVLLTTPDMLHYALLPHAHRLWEWLFRGLETVVVDEVHEYRGVFGSHVALVLRRLARVCERFDADPSLVCCSATIRNPVEHAAAVTGQPAASFALVEQDDSGTGPTHWALWNPPEHAGGTGRRRSNHVETMRIMADLVTEGHQTVAFTDARQTAERYASETADLLGERGHHGLADSVAAYQAALADERRRGLETGLHDGDLRGVWSTNALELGVDVGGLDAVLLDGYPGTRMAARQQAGRAGRGDDPSLVVVVAGEDQLDQYLARNPSALFDEPPERAAADPENDQLLPDHVRSAARENWLSPDDDRHFGEPFPGVVADLTRWATSHAGRPTTASVGRTVGREVPSTRWGSATSPTARSSCSTAGGATALARYRCRTPSVTPTPGQSTTTRAERTRSWTSISTGSGRNSTPPGSTTTRRSATRRRSRSRSTARSGRSRGGRPSGSPT
jgi:DEAD/DEAH box helicase domain-containing protein